MSIKFELNNFTITTFQSIAEMASIVGSQKTILISINALTLLGANPALGKLTSQHTGYIDGVGVWLVARRSQNNIGVRIAGADLWLELLRQKPDARIYCIGSTREVIEATIEKLKADFPCITICGFRDGFLSSAEDEAELIENVVRTQPEFVFIATGQPRQELLAEKLFAAHPALYAGLGGSFDVYAGKLKRAPYWVQKCGMEWLFRLCQEPQRWKRMVPLVKLLPMLLISQPR